MILKITSSSGETASYTIIIKGDVNGDGNITPADYVKVKNCILQVSSLNGSYLEAADMNDSNSITPADYVKIKNIILG